MNPPSMDGSGLPRAKEDKEEVLPVEHPIPTEGPRRGRWTMRLLVLTALVFGGLLFNAFGAVATAAAATITTGDPTCLNFENQVFGAYINGNCKGYREGDYMSFRVSLTQSGSGTATGTIDIIWDGPASNCFWTSYFALGHNGESPPAGRPVDPINTGPFTVTAGAVQTLTDGYQVTLTITSTSPGAQSGVVNFTLQLASTAANPACSSGSSQHVQTTNATGGVSHTGNQTTSIAAGNIIDLPDITVIKKIDTDGDGDVDRNATANEYCFDLTPNPPTPSQAGCVNTDASGQVVFTGVTPNTTNTNFTITETQLDFSTAAYGFNQTATNAQTQLNCTFNATGTATATVRAENEQGTITVQNATCTYVNSLVELSAEFRSFSARALGRSVLLRWRTSLEANVLGFNVYRQVGRKRVRLNRSLIPAQSVVSSRRGGHSYSFRARAATRRQRTARYWLQIVHADGSRSWHGPVRPGAAT